MNDSDPRPRVTPLEAPRGAFDVVMTTVRRRQRRRRLLLTSAPIVVVLALVAALAIGKSSTRQKLSTESQETTTSTSTSASVTTSTPPQESTTTSSTGTTPDVGAPTTTTSTTPPEVLGDEPLLIGDKDGVYEMNPDGTARTLLFSDAVTWVSWSRARDRVALTTAAGAVMVRNIDGSDNHVVAANGGHANLSPDGTRVVYACDVQAGSHVCVVNSDGTGMVDLTPNATFALDGAWSPDGTQLVYRAQQTYQGNQQQLLIILDLATGQQRTLLAATDQSEFFNAPDWSPDRSMIAYARKPANDIRYDIWVVNVDGTGARQLSSSLQSISPRWSPDGSRIGFECTTQTQPRPNNEGPFQTAIWWILPSGGAFFPLANTTHDQSSAFAFDW